MFCMITIGVKSNEIFSQMFNTLTLTIWNKIMILNLIFNMRQQFEFLKHALHINYMYM